MIRTCNYLYHTWEACLCTPLALHGMIWGGAASQGEVHSRGSDLHECFVTYLMSPIVNKGESLRLIFLCIWEWVMWDWKFLLVTGGAECALIWLSVAYCEGMHLGYVFLVVSELLLALVPVVSSLCLFLEERVFAFAWLCWVLPLSWGVMLSLIGCVELFPLS